jgi:hypothetical protein
MKPKKILVIVLTVFLILFAKAFAGGDKIMNKLIGGNIIYAISDKIYSMNLNNVEKNIISIDYKQLGNSGVTVLHHEANTVFSGLTKVDENKFLFVQQADVKGAVGFIIKEFNSKTKQVRTLHEGQAPLYMQKYHQLLFFDDGLEIADINNPIKTTKKITDGGRSVRHLISVSDSEVVFIKEDTGAANDVWRYSLINHSLGKLPIKGCTFPSLWIDKTEQLVCFDRNAKTYFLADLQGNKEKELSFGKNTAIPLINIPGTTSLIMNVVEVANSDEIYNLYIYDLTTGEKKLISKNNGFGLGDGIYYPR